METKATRPRRKLKGTGRQGASTPLDRTGILGRAIQVREISEDGERRFEAVCEGISRGEVHSGRSAEEAIGALILAGHSAFGIHIAMLKCTAGIPLPIGGFLGPIIDAVAEEERRSRGF